MSLLTILHNVFLIATYDYAKTVLQGEPQGSQLNDLGLGVKAQTWCACLLLGVLFPSHLKICFILCVCEYS